MTESVIIILVLLLGAALGAASLWFVKLRRLRSINKSPLVSGPFFPVTQPPQLKKRPEVEFTQWNQTLGIAIQQVKDLDLSSLTREDLSPDRRAILDRIALGHIVEAVPFIKAAIEGGRIARIIGPEALLQGLDAGTLMQLGATSALQDATGQIVGHLRVGELQNIRKFAGPMAAWQVLSAVTCQYYLNRITIQLSGIEKAVADIQKYLKNEKYAELKVSAKTLQRLSERPLNELSDMDRHELSTAGGMIDVAYELCLKNLDDHASRARNLLSKGRCDIDRSEFLRLLKDLESDYSEEAWGLCSAIQRKVEYLRLRHWVDSAAQPNCAGIRMRQLERDINEMRERLSKIVDDMEEILGIKLDHTWLESFAKQSFSVMDSTVPIITAGKAIAKLARWDKSFADKLHQTREKLRELHEGMRNLFPADGMKPRIIEIGKDPVSGHLIGIIRTSDVEQ
jgi:hypothetical protein